MRVCSFVFASCLALAACGESSSAEPADGGTHQDAGSGGSGAAPEDAAPPDDASPPDDAEPPGDAATPPPHGWDGGRPEDIANNIWSWWVHPLAVNDLDVTWVGGIARDATVQITRVNADRSLETVALGQTAADDHNGPAIAYHPDQPDLVVFFSEHNGESHVNYRRVDRISLLLGPPEQLAFSGDVSYAQALVHGDRIVLVTRVVNPTWRYRVSDDFGATWSEERMLVNAEGWGKVYSLSKPTFTDPTKAQLAFYGHPTGSDFRDVMHGLIDLETGRVTTVGGAELGDLDDPGGPGLLPDPPSGEPRLETAISPSAGYVVRLLDVGELGGMPAILYVVWTGTETPHYRVKLRRTSGEWSSAGWMPATGAVFGYSADIHYHAGAVFTRDGGVVSSREENGTWRVERWSWEAASEDLVLAEELSATSRPVVRPYVPFHDGRADLIAHELERYEAYTDYLAATRFLAP